MNDFKILVCEDDSSDQLNISLHIKTVIRSLSSFDIKFEIVDFDQIFDKINNPYDLLILDLFDNNSQMDKGSQVLMHNNEINRIPTLIYTSTGDGIGFNLKFEKNRYPFLIDKFTKNSGSGDELISFLKGYIITTKSESFYKPYNTNDKPLSLAIKYIGEKNFNYIIYLFKENYSIKDEIVIYPMTPGWSGAVLFKLRNKSDEYVLKLSRDIDSLTKELNNSESLYNKFPSHFINPIHPTKFYSFDNQIFGFSIKNIESSVPLLSFISNRQTSSANIESIFNDLFFKANALKDHYKNKKDCKKNWTAIVEKINEGKIHWVSDSYKNLNPIIKKYYKVIDIDNFRRLCVNHDYLNLNPSKQVHEKYEKELVLSHGDFHAKNILVQSNARPFIIDTGALSYQYWSLDITRLLISIFILGLDNERIEYFDLDRLKYYLELGDKIIKRESFDIAAGDSNYNVLYSINWLIINIENIYETQFSLFEYQLGLLKELLQVSYRLDTVPPNKRALALILADKCLIEANTNVL